MEPITTALTGLALVQKSVGFIKSNIATANDIKDIAGALDSLFAGEKQIQSERFADKSVIGQTKDVANKIIDAKLAQEAMDEMRSLINHRFGSGTFQQIIAERNKQIREEKERILEEKRKKRQEQEELMQIIKVTGFSAFGLMVVVLLGTLWYLSHG